MMEATEDRGLPDRPNFGRFDSPRYWTLLLQPKMRAALVVVADELGQYAVEVSHVQHDHVIQAVPPHRPDQPLYIWILPGRSWSRRHVLDSHRFDHRREDPSVDVIPVAQDVGRG